MFWRCMKITAAAPTTPKTMTGHEGEPDDAAFAAFRASIEPLELSGKLRAILLQYHPRFVKSAEALAVTPGG